jgi:hypothetical protein
MLTAVFILVAVNLNYNHGKETFDTLIGENTEKTNFVRSAKYDAMSFENIMSREYHGEPILMWYFFLFYATAYFGIALPGLLLTKKISVLKDYKFWIKSLVFIGLIGVLGGFRDYGFILDKYNDPQDRYFLFKLIVNLKRMIPYLIVLIIMKFIFDRNVKGIYGFRFNEVHLKPYFILLLFVVPLVFYASFQADFLETYPKFKYWKMEEAFGMSTWQTGVIFELIYGLDFITVELVFRGALIIGMISIMGKEALLPMVATYAFLHFGKPMGETISSVFGGYILGVIAYETKHIFGGVIAHVGVAYMMETGALIMHNIKGGH